MASGSFFKDMKAPALHLLSMYGAQSFFTFMYIYLLSGIGEKLATSIRHDLFKSLLKQDIEFFDKHRTGELVNRLTTDVQDFKSSFKQTISQGLRAIAQLIGGSTSLYIISPALSSIAFVCIPTAVIIGSYVGSILRKKSREAQAQMERATGVLDEAISNIRTVRAFAMEDTESDLFLWEAERAQTLNEDLGVGIAMFQAATNLFLNGLVLGTLYAGGSLLATDQLTAGELMAFLVASQNVQKSLAQGSMLLGSVVRGMSAGARVMEYIGIEPKVPLKGGMEIPPNEFNGNIKFCRVSFAYPTRPGNTVLKDFSLDIPAGKTVALVGVSGSGKSTVANLIERFYEPKTGSISIDGYDLKELCPTWLRGTSVGLIEQNPTLFATTVMENIRYGKPTASDEQVIEAAMQANAHEFILGFTNGYRTLVGERGAALSGGQKQRIAIARALLKNPKILVLDEATSALDTQSEALVQRALDNATKGRTVVVIAHRLSTIRNADIIVVMKHGKIVEVGWDVK
ncbi:ATP-binding cassette sub-family B member 8, mitochondrial-like [Ctenocephalides felis]|uniref:ATP-binding cassette sub-family B member 8, mitochondrial-like n=1 Tax=Ctenocephalides felis TaxID=7515 RepID=UPI000E6E442A|nr:ATP-binding cassette sub-family B member 8, mitochondrial-like [Ctenocephalides felis]